MNQPREGSRDTEDGLIISVTPDVGSLIIGGIILTVPQSICAKQSDDANTEPSVRFTKQRAHHFSSIVTECTGIFPGITSGTIGGACQPKQHSETVRVKGKWAVRNDDAWYMNNENTLGKLFYLKSAEVFDPTPASKHGGDTGTEFDTGEEERGFGDLLNDVKNRASDGLNDIIEEYKDSYKSFALTAAMLANQFGRIYEAAEFLNSTQHEANESAYQNAADALGISLDTNENQWVAFAYGHSNNNAGTVFTPLEIPTGGFEKSAALRAIAFTERDNPGSFRELLYSSDNEVRKKTIDMYQSAVDKAVSGASLEAEIAYEEELLKKLTGQVRVTNIGESSSGCEVSKICFMPGAGIASNPKKMVEYKRQLELQEDGINEMSPEKLLKNRKDFKNITKRSKIDKISSDYRSKARRKYEKHHKEYLKKKKREKSSRSGGKSKKGVLTTITRIVKTQFEIMQHMASKDILHNPDTIAGGDPKVIISKASLDRVKKGKIIPEVGDSSVNRSIGSGWRGSRANLLEDYAEEKSANGCSSTKVDLDVCESKKGSLGVPKS